MNPRTNFSILPITLVVSLLGFSSVGIAEIDADALAAYVRVLASDEFEGRAPGTPGGRKSVDYIESRMRKSGLQPAASGSYWQTVPLLSKRVVGAGRCRIEGKHDSIRLRWPEDIVFSPGRTRELALSESELVFDGRGLSRYGSVEYERQEAGGRGAAGMILIHDPDRFGLPWETLRLAAQATKHDLPEDETRVPGVRMVMYGPVAERLFELAGTTLTAATAEASVSRALGSRRGGRCGRRRHDLQRCDRQCDRQRGAARDRRRLRLVARRA